MTEIDHIRVAQHVLPLLYVTTLVALSAFISGRRDVFYFGVIGASLASCIPGPAVHTDYSSVEGAVMGMYSGVYWHSLFYRAVGALIGLVAGVCWVQLARRKVSNLPDNNM